MEKSVLVSKRAQITVFIIIGVILLLLVGSVIVIRTITTERELPSAPALGEIPTQARPIRTYTESCLRKITIEALDIIGDHGGYIDLAGFDINPNDPTESEGLQFHPDSDMKTVYWFYMDSENDCAGDCTWNSERPELKDGDSSVESQIDQYIIEFLPICLENYDPFTEQGIILEAVGDINPTTTITESDVRVYLDYPIKITRAENIFEVSEYNVILPVNFKKMYDFATNITEAEKEYHFLERTILDLIVPYSGLESTQLPPITEMAFGIGKETYWVEHDVENKIKNILTQYIQVHQVFATKNYRRILYPANPLKQKFYDNMDLALNLDHRYDNLAVTFDYIKWPIYFNIGEALIRPEGIVLPYINIGVQKYDNPYDISFPTVVTITDPEALNGRGYSLRFALEANIRNTEPIDAEFPGFEGTKLLENSLFCNPDQRTSGNITFIVTDNDNKPVSDVQIMYTIDESCVIGATNESGMLVAQLPIARGGVVSFINFNYLIPSQILDTYPPREITVPAQGVPYTDKKVSVVKLKYNQTTGKIPSTTFPLTANEEVSIFLTRVKENPGEEEIAPFANYVWNQTEPSQLIRLVPGKYEVELLLSYTAPYSYTDRIEWREGILNEKKHKDIRIPAEGFLEFIQEGGAVMNAETGGYFVITQENLYSDKEIEFVVLSFGLPTRLAHMELVDELDAFSRNNKAKLKPRFK